MDRTTTSQDEKGHRWFAAAYDLMGRASERGSFGRIRRDLLRDLSGDVVEVGAGTGSNFAHYPEGVRVVALEPDPHMLKRAEKKLAELGRNDIEVRLAPAERLPLDDASFDVAVSTLVLCTVRDPAQSVAEIMRVLRPGGELRFVEHVRGGKRLGRFQDAVQPAWGWCSAGCQLGRDTEAELLRAGFAISELRHTRLAPWMPAIIGTARKP